MILRILAHNTLDAFSDPVTADAFVTLVERAQPDAVFFSEAYDAERPALITEVVRRFKRMGYNVLHGDYNDSDHRKDLHGFMLLARIDLCDAHGSAAVLRIGGRNMAQCWLQDAHAKCSIRFVGVHLNDRSEAKRQAELDDLLTTLSADEPTVIVGDFNAIYEQDARGLKVQIARFINQLVRLRLFPAPEPVTATNPKKGIGRVGNLAKRFSEMASGKTLERFTTAGFADADSQHRPTYPAREPFVQLDHIMLSRDLRVRSFKTLPRNSSDHLGIIAEVEL